LTTIAYRDGVLAADTLTTASGTRCGEMAKIYREGRLLVGFCGNASNFEAFRSWVRAGAEGRFKSENGNVFILPPEGPAVVWGDGDYPWREAAPFWALGSGESIALGAMAVGATAEQAVRAAIEFDTASGGNVTVLSREG
jgi:20S proteasome alpha/beta subunit